MKPDSIDVQILTMIMPSGLSNSAKSYIIGMMKSQRIIKVVRIIALFIFSAILKENVNT